jgi:hypothetical protein
VVLVSADIATLPMNSPDGHYHFKHNWNVLFQVGDIIDDILHTWILIHEAIDFSLFKSHRTIINTNCNLCTIGILCSCYIEIVVIPRPHIPRVLSYIDLTTDELTRGCGCDEQAETKYEISDYIAPAFDLLFQLDVDTDVQTASDFLEDDAAIALLKIKLDTCRDDLDQEASYEDRDDAQNDALKITAIIARDDLTIDRDEAAIASFDRSICEIDRRLHQIRYQYLDMRFALASVNLEIAKLQ